MSFELRFKQLKVLNYRTFRQRAACLLYIHTLFEVRNIRKTNRRWVVRTDGALATTKSPLISLSRYRCHGRSGFFCVPSYFFSTPKKGFLFHCIIRASFYFFTNSLRRSLSRARNYLRRQKTGSTVGETDVPGGGGQKDLTPFFFFLALLSLSSALAVIRRSPAKLLMIVRDVFDIHWVFFFFLPL